MKILDTLTIGNWILLLNQETHLWEPTEVTPEILRYAGENEIRPIKLTTEILRNSKFTERDAIPGIISWKEWVSSDGRVILCDNQDFINSNNLWAVHIDNEDMETIGNVELSYIHQLQNILKHYGIKLEIKI